MPIKRKQPPRNSALARSTLARLRGQLDCLAIILEGADRGALHERSPDGKWSAHENLAHLARYHEVFLSRLEKMLSEESPELGRYRSEVDPGAARWFELETPDVLAGLKELRARLTRRVSGLGDDQLVRSGGHPVFGEMSIALWVEFFLAHEGHHLYQVFQRVRQSSTRR